MKNNQTFNKFRSKLTREAVLKAFLVGLGVGFAACGLIALICWLVGFKDGIWVALGAGFGLGLLSVPLLFLRFRPSDIDVSRRIDALGLQERAVTMLQYQQNDSYMAARQRSDATVRVNDTDVKIMATVVPLWIVVAVICAFVFCVPFGVVSGLYKFSVIDSPASENPFEKFVSVSYVAEDGGEIIGETDQLLSPGEDATTVTAAAMDGYIFVGWTDGNNNPERTDLKITQDMEIYAMFESVDGDGENIENGDFDANEGDQATDQPGDGDGQANGSDGDGSGNKGDGEGSGSGNDKGDGKGDGQGEGAGGKWSEGNKIINGEIFYRDYLSQYHAEAMQELTSLDDLPPEIREFIEAYYESV